jgi:hypothetical protein
VNGGRHEAAGRSAGLGLVEPGAGRYRESPHRAARHGRAVRRRHRRSRLAGLLRFVVFLLLIFIAVWAGVRVAHAGTDASIYTGHAYVVRAGDTLWRIAAHEYGPGTDLRRAVFQIRKANRLSASVVQPGERITLPYLGD